MAIEVSRNDVNLFAGHRVVQQHVAVLGVEAQRLGTDEAHSVVGLAVEHVSVLLHQLQLLRGGVETTRIVNPPVGLVLNGYSIHVDPILLHISQEGVQPREELAVAVFAQLATLLALRVAVATLRGAVGLIFAWGRPWGAKDDAATLLHNLGRGQRPLPVVGRVVVVPFRHNDIAHEIGRNLHAHDVQPNLRRGAIEQLHGIGVGAKGTHGTIAAGCTKARHLLVARVLHCDRHRGSMNSRKRSHRKKRCCQTTERRSDVKDSFHNM